MFRPWVLLAMVLTAAVSSRGAGAAEIANSADNAILTELLEKGISVDDHQLLLPKPSLPDGADAAAEKAALSKIADATHPVEALHCVSVVALFVIKRPGGEEGSKSGTLRTLDLWFVAYGDLNKLTDESLLKSQRDSGAGKEPRTRTPAASFRPTICKPVASPICPAKSTWALAPRCSIGCGSAAPCKRCSRARRTRRWPPRESTPVSPKIAGFPTSGGRSRETSPERAHGWRPASCAKRLVGTPRRASARTGTAAILVEYHVVFDEPAGWFNGAN